MRTTLSVDDHLLDAAKRRARERGVSLGHVVEDALRRELAGPAEIERPEIPVFKGGGMRPGIDPSSNRAIIEALDEGVPLDKLR